jgi:hypothetical protein
LLKKSVQTFRAEYNKMGPKRFMNYMEETGKGHTFEMHGKKIDGKLVLRANKQKNIIAASAFNYNNKAIDSADEIIRKNMVDIIKWRENPLSKGLFKITHLHEYPLGKAVAAGREIVKTGLKKTKIIIAKDFDPKNLFGIKIVTFYPIVKK